MLQTMMATAGKTSLWLTSIRSSSAFIKMKASRVKYKEPLLLFENTVTGFKNVSTQSGNVFTKEFSGRGMAVGDFDNDGDLDVLISNNGEAPLLLRNEGGNRNN